MRAEADGQSSVACDAYWHASTYYAAALDGVFHCSEPERQPAIWQRQRFCFERALTLGSRRSERLSIPYGEYTLPGFFFPSEDAEQGEVRPLLIVNHGLDRPTSQTLAYGDEIARACGVHWMTFDGPGQQATLYEQGVACRPDWEAVFSTVIDAVLCDQMSTPRIAAIGIGHGGYLLTRALCFEHRITAAASTQGSSICPHRWTDHSQPLLAGQLTDNDRLAFDREIQLAELFSPESAATLRMTSQAFGVDNHTRFDLFKSIRGYRLGAELSSMTTPLLIVDHGHASPWPGQSRLLNNACRRPQRSSTPPYPDTQAPVPGSGPPRSDRRITDWFAEQFATHNHRG